MDKMPNGVLRYVRGYLGKKILNTPENRFKLKCSEPNENGCILWKGPLKGHGYGQFSLNGKRVYVHRYAYEKFYGITLTTEMWICHKCDEPSCVNPEHLFVGSAASNNADSIRKKRSHWAKNPILTDMQRDEIYQNILSGVSVTKLSKDYKVSKSTCYKIFYERENLK